MVVWNNIIQHYVHCHCLHDDVVKFSSSPANRLRKSFNIFKGDDLKLGGWMVNQVLMRSALIF